MLSRRSTGNYREVQRAQIILYASEGYPNTRIAKMMNCSPYKVKRWRSRWLEECDHLSQKESSDISDKELKDFIITILTDKARSGKPPIYSAEDYCRLMALALERPEDSGYPISHWTARELRIECEVRGIAVGISERQIGRFLKRI